MSNSTSNILRDHYFGRFVDYVSVIAARKPFPVRNQAQRDYFQESAVDSAQFVSKHLFTLIADPENENAKFSVHMASGPGPAWTWVRVNEYLQLQPEKQEWICSNLTPTVNQVTTALMSRASDEGWDAVWSQVGDTLGWLNGSPLEHPGYAGKDRLLTISDLFVRRYDHKQGSCNQIPQCPRLVVELVHRSHWSDKNIGDTLESMDDKYGSAFTEHAGFPIASSALYYRASGGVKWLDSSDGS